MYYPTQYKSKTPIDASQCEPGDPFYGVRYLVQAYNFLPYSHQRIKEILWTDYGLELDFIHPGYKGNRYPGYVNKYRVLNAETKEVVVERTTLNALRHFLAGRGHTVESPNHGAVTFLRAVEAIREKMEAEANEQP